MTISTEKLKKLRLEELTASEKVATEQAIEAKIRESYATEVESLKKRIVEGESFDPQDYGLWVAINFPPLRHPLDELNKKAEDLAKYIGQHAGQMVVYDREKISWPKDIKIGIIDKSGLVLVRRQIPKPEDFGDLAKTRPDIIAHFCDIDPTENPLLLSISTVDNVVGFAYSGRLKVGDDGRVVPGTFTKERSLPGFSRHLVFSPNNLIVSAEEFPTLEYEDDRFKGSYAPMHMTRRSTAEPYHMESGLTHLTKIVAGDKAVVEHLTERTGIDFSRAKSPLEIYDVLGGN